MNVEWTTRMNDDVTLVEVVVTNNGPPRRVRVSNELDGPVWPPRQRGIPAAGWNEHGYEGYVEGRCALGYSTPAPAIDPPVSIEWLEVAPVPDEERSDQCPVPIIAPEPTPNGVYRTLNDPRPPRSAVPVPVESVVDEEAMAGRNAPEAITERKRSRDTETRVTNHPSIESLFRTIERRVEDGEMLTEAETLPDATWAVETVGGLTAVADLTTALEADRETLRTIEERAKLLREQAERVDVPVDTLERLA